LREVEIALAYNFFRCEGHEEVVVKSVLERRHPLEAPSHSPFVVSQFAVGCTRDRQETYVPVPKVLVNTVEIVRPEGAAFAACIPRRIKHEVIGDELGAGAEKVCKGFFAVRPLEHIVLYDNLPWEVAPVLASSSRRRVNSFSFASRDFRDVSQSWCETTGWSFTLLLPSFDVNMRDSFLRGGLKSGFRDDAGLLQ